MPIPKPKKNEKEDEFIGRCMGDKVMNDDYPDREQRAAVCHQKWRDKDKTAGQFQNAEYLAGQPVSSINSERRTVDILFFSGIDIPRVNFWTGEKYVLRFDPAGADLSLLNNGAPVLDNHNAYGGTVAQKGVVEKAWGADGKWYATLRFSKRSSVDELWHDIKDKIVTKFSMGVEILSSEKKVEDDEQVLLATEWRPFELSLAPIPADFNTTTLAAEPRGLNNPMGTSPEGEIMPDKTETSGTGAQADKTLNRTAEQIYAEALENARQKGIIEELARVKRILEVNGWCQLPESFARTHIDAGTSTNDFQTFALNEQSRRGLEYGPQSSHHAQMVRDETETRRELMATALTGLLNPAERKEDKNNQFIGLSVKQIAEESVRQEKGLRSTPPVAKVVELAMQVTSDFAYVLENVARKQLLRVYELAAPSYKIWTKRSTTPDFKTMSRVRLSEAPTFLKVPEGAQITLGLMSDSRETYTLATYGRGVSFSRQMLINDDLGAFNDLIGQFGAQAARLENKTVYAILTTNANMADSIALFDDQHSNHGAGALGNTGFDAMFSAMGIQKGLDGVSILNIQPKYVIVPKAKEATAKANLLATGPNLAATSQNWFAGRLEPVADGELDATSTTVWYGAADPAIYPGIEYCYLQGQEGPQFIRKENESGILGLQFYCFLDFAAKAVDWRPLYYSTGS